MTKVDSIVKARVAANCFHPKEEDSELMSNAFIQILLQFWELQITVFKNEQEGWYHWTTILIQIFNATVSVYPRHVQNGQYVYCEIYLIWICFHNLNCWFQPTYMVYPIM
ncbi:hypothetical protein K435DRAFT_793103 [Dendrothele bispora CBS 962.96]|uniref:Uncharacterized protein n=1 Tax=Dendrothele bispora (strain CBS 962.96) TaxID=1314807 RepID=A0A4S8MHY9_DENBC|nr:hypothetical protein K435DRAFT_793103 [Dendrothele bispora CBS 962.96]